jgi:hypothetical protein
MFGPELGMLSGLGVIVFLVVGVVIALKVSDSVGK